MKKMGKKNSKRGIILIYVLGFTLAITTLLLVVHYKTEQFMDEFTSKIYFMQMENLAQSGYSIGKNLLEIDKNSYDWYGESWGKDIEIDIEKYKIKVKITDEDGKININKVIGEKGEINTLLLQTLKGIFTISGYSDSLVDCLLDWIDEDELPRSLGAESTFYKMSNYPYVPPNRLLYSIEEITLIKNFNKEIIYGMSKEQNEEEKEDKETNNEENNNQEVKKGLINFISTISDDKINVNTCEWEILSSMGYSEANIDQIMDQRGRSPLSENWLLEVNREVTLNNKRIIKYTSSNFSINVLVEDTENEKTINLKFFVFRDMKNNIKLLRKEKVWTN